MCLSFWNTASSYQPESRNLSSCGFMNTRMFYRLIIRSWRSTVAPAEHHYNKTMSIMSLCGREEPMFEPIMMMIFVFFLPKGSHNPNYFMTNFFLNMIFLWMFRQRGLKTKVHVCHLFTCYLYERLIKRPYIYWNMLSISYLLHYLYY